MNSTVICNAQLTDIAKVVEIHSTCFKDSFSTSLGKNILFDYYNSYLTHNPKLFLVAKHDDKIVGFVVGYCCDDKTAFTEFKKKCFFKIFFRVLFRIFLLDKRVYKKIFSKSGGEAIILPLLNSTLKSEKGDLLSICVLPEYRKNKIATKLEKEFNDALLRMNRRYCILSCLDSNSSANHFYKKLGYVIYKKNNFNNYYIKAIDK